MVAVIDSMDYMDIGPSSSTKTINDLLDSFVNLKQYDKLLFYLEANLFSNPPNLNCPSPFIIRVVLSLATIGHYNNADLIRREYGTMLSEQHINVRAVNLLKTLIRIVTENITNSDKSQSPFEPQKFSQSSISAAADILIESLDFFREDRFKQLRSRVLKKAYRENKRTKWDTSLDKETLKQQNKQNEFKEEEDWSPQKRVLEREFARLEAEQKQNMGLGDGTGADENEDDDDMFFGSSDKKSLKILKNDRIDALLSGERIWNLISWAFSCGSSKDQLHRESWKVWAPVLEIIFDILNLELELFIKEPESLDKDDVCILFQNTICYKFLLKAGKYNFPKKATEFIFQKFDRKILPLVDHDLTVSSSVHLTRELLDQSNAKVVTENTADLRRKLFFLIVRASSLIRPQDQSTIYSSNDGLVSDIVSEMKYALVQDLNFDDMINFFRFSTADLETDWKSVVISDLLVCHLVQLTTFHIEDVIGEEDDWILNKESLTFIQELFENTSYEKRFYGVSESLDFTKLKMDFSKMAVILFNIFTLWLKASKTTLTDKQLDHLVKLAAAGEKKRIEVINSCKRKYEKEELRYLTDLLDEWQKLSK